LRTYRAKPFFLFLQVLATQGLGTRKPKSAKNFLAIEPPPLLYSRIWIVYIVTVYTDFRKNQPCRKAPPHSYRFAPWRLGAQPYLKYPTNSYSIRNMPSRKQNVEIFNSVEQKPFPSTPSFSNIKKIPRQQAIQYGTSNVEKRAKIEICPRKNLPLPWSLAPNP
jgi:hypothetical protein